eukprot:3923599-Karenia_brevis.AAC.1
MSPTLILDQIRSITRCKKLEDVFPKMIELDKLYLEYFEARNVAYGDIERKADLIRIVPEELQKKLMLEIDDLDTY